MWTTSMIVASMLLVIVAVLLALWLQGQLMAALQPLALYR